MNTIKRLYSVLILLILAILAAHAHEFWLQPGFFFAKSGQQVPIEVMVGEGFLGERSEGKKNRIVQYTHLANGTKEDLSPALANDHYGVTSIKLKTLGTHLVAFANTPKYLSMRADSFLLYLQEDGLDNVIQTRKQQNDTQKRSRELYRRCVKTLIQVGDKPDQTFSVNTGMPLEIIPLQNPYAIQSGKPAEFQILFDQKPLSGALVRYWNRTPANQLHQEQQRTDKQGRVRFGLRSGSNMVSLVRMIPYAGSSESKSSSVVLPPADWISYWGSLTFGHK